MKRKAGLRSSHINATRERHRGSPRFASCPSCRGRSAGPSTTPSFSIVHAFQIARLQPDGQRRALLGCFPDHRTTAAILRDAKAEAVTVPQLRVDRAGNPRGPADAPCDPQDGFMADRALLLLRRGESLRQWQY
jgi:hypothetical protein